MKERSPCPIVDKMKARRLPLTREVYLSLGVRSRANFGRGSSASAAVQKGSPVEIYQEKMRHRG